VITAGAKKSEHNKEEKAKSLAKICELTNTQDYLIRKEIKDILDSLL
jgi:hypothetical protein